MTRHIKSVLVYILLLFSVGITHAQPTSDLLAMVTDDHVAADAFFVYATDKDKLIIDLTLSTADEGVTMFRDASKVGDAMKDVNKISDVTSATYKQYKQLNGIKNLSNLMILGKDGKYFKWSDIKDELIVELGERYAKFCDDFIAIARNSNKHLDLISCDLPSGIRGDGAGSRSGKCNRRLVKAWDVLFSNSTIRKQIGSLESVSDYLNKYPDRGPLLKSLFGDAAGNETAYVNTIKKLDDDLDAIVLDGTASLGLDDATKAARDWLTPEAGWYDVIVHGGPDEFKVFTGTDWVSLNHRDLANFLNSQGYAGGKVRLVSCQTGVFPDGIGQHLSNKLGVDVKAPKANITVFSDGTYQIAGGAGWRDFTPGTIP